MLTFRQHNLMEPLRERPFDLVLLKNVLIYFGKPSKAVVLDNIRPVLRPAGCDRGRRPKAWPTMLPDFQRLEPWLYRKPVA